MNAEATKLAADLDRRLLGLDQKIERHEKQRQQNEDTLTDLYKARLALLAAHGALASSSATIKEAAE